MKQGSIYINDKLVHFPSKEEQVIKLLLENSNEVVTYEDIAKQLWENDWLNRFSLEAIIQVIKRIRKGLREVGVSRNVIQCVRKKGYVLVG